MFERQHLRPINPGGAGARTDSLPGESHAGEPAWVRLAEVCPRRHDGAWERRTQAKG